jgi:hypothetical protein
MNETHSVLMSSSIARTAPARCRAHGVDDVSVRGDTDAGAPDEVAIVDGDAPEVVVGAVDGRDDLAVVDEKYEVLPHADNVGVMVTSRPHWPIAMEPSRLMTSEA